MWTAKFDRPVAELAELQEELVTEVAASLDTQVYDLEMARALRKPGDITAWEAVARSLSAYRSYDAAALRRASDEARRAVAIAPDYAPGHAALANALANGYFSVGREDPATVAQIRAIVERALALAPDDVTVLAYAGLALCFVGHPEDGERYTGRAARKAPGSGIWHFYDGIACVMLNRPDAALARFGVAERLMQGSHMMWALKMWPSIAYRELGRWEESAMAIDESISLIPTFAQNYVYKAGLCVRLGQDAAARRQIQTARGLGTKMVYAERFWRRMSPNSPTLESDLDIIRALFEATAPLT